MSEIKQPNKNWINDHNFNKDLTFKTMENKKTLWQRTLRRRGGGMNCECRGIAINDVW